MTALNKSLWVFHFNAGSCNGCDIEIVATITPRYDPERFGVKLVGSPRHADVLLVTGPVTNQMADRLRRVYAQMASPKVVMAVGTCAQSGGVFSTLQDLWPRLSRSTYTSRAAPRDLRPLSME